MNCLTRRTLVRWLPAAWVTAWGLAGCATPAPPPRLVYLRAAPPVAIASPPASTQHWQLLLPVRVPDYLDRDAVLVPQGKAGLQAEAGVRWAEPLRESVPRLLREDLATLLGPARVWTSPLPAGLVVQRQLRVELLALEPTSDRRAVTLRARWTLADPAGGSAPRAESMLLEVPAGGDDVDSLVEAHRLALWRLAERLAAN